MDPVNEIDVSNMTPRQWMLVIILNLLVLAELCTAMYLAAANPDEFTATFIKAFFGMLIPTLVIGVLAKRWLRPVPDKFEARNSKFEGNPSDRMAET